MKRPATRRKKLKIKVRSGVRKKRLKALGLAAAAVFLTTGAVGGFIALKNRINDYLSSERFAVREISAEGLRELDEKTILARLEPLRESTIWKADYAHLAALIKEKHPRVKSVKFRRMPPGRVRVVIKERIPSALVDGETLAAADSGMNLFEPTESEKNSLPVIKTSAENCRAADMMAFLDLMDEAGDGAREFKKRLRKLYVESGALKMSLDDGTVVLWGEPPKRPFDAKAAEDAAGRISRLTLVLDDAARRFGGCRYADMTQSSRSGRRIVVMPRDKKI